MKILFLTSGLRTPATRYRIVPYIRRLRQAGLTCHVAHSFPDKYESFAAIGWRASQALKRWTRRCHLRSAQIRRYDAIVIEREIFDSPNAEMEAAFRAATEKFLLDIDDAIFLRYPEKFATIARMSDCILAGNRNLAEKCQEFCPRVSLLPTAIELDDYPRTTSRPAGGPPVIGWIGTPANLPYLETLIPAFQQLTRQHDFRLRIVTSQAEALGRFRDAGLPLEFRRWRPRTAIQEIQAFSVGVMPLHDGEWERYKCGFKLLQYMACQVPGVASPVGVNSEIVESGKNGLLANSLDQWEESLATLLTSAEFARQLAQAGRRTVEERYSTEVHLPTLLAALRS